MEDAITAAKLATSGRAPTAAIVRTPSGFAVDAVSLDVYSNGTRTSHGTFDLNQRVVDLLRTGHNMFDAPPTPIVALVDAPHGVAMLTDRIVRWGFTSEPFHEN